MTPGTVAVIGLGKIGLPLAAQYLSAGWRVIGVDVRQDVIDHINAGESHIPDEPGVAELLRVGHEDGRLSATTSHAQAASEADVVVIIVPLMLTAAHEPDYRLVDAATRAVAAGLRPGTLVVYETTLPVGDTRLRFLPLLESGSGLRAADGDAGVFVAFSPERVYSGRILSDLRAYPKLVGGVDAESAARAVAFYRSVLAAEVWDLGASEAAELAKLAETTYRDVNIAFANELADYAQAVGVDVLEVIRGANSQPYSHLHEPGIGVGGHCIPVYPHFLIGRTSELSIARQARQVNDDQVRRAVDAVEDRLGDLAGLPVLLLGLTYRANVNELAYSRGPALVAELRERGAAVDAYDPLLPDDEIVRTGAEPWAWGETSDAVAIVTQTADPRWSSLEPAWFPDLRLVYDGRNSLRASEFPPTVTYLGVGYDPMAGRAGPAGPHRPMLRSGSRADPAPSVSGRGAAQRT